MADLSPMMKQYTEIKKKNPDSILFFRLGDFYEMFYEDAIIASRELDLTLTGKVCGQEERAPMCGVPYHSCETYIAKLVANGHKVAICEQTEDPATAKGLVKREVIRVVTAGTVIESSMLDSGSNNYISCVYTEETSVGVSFCDISTGKLYATALTGSDCLQRLKNEIFSFMPNEILCNDKTESLGDFKNYIKERLDRNTEVLNNDFFERANSVFMQYFPNFCIEETEFKDFPAAVRCVAGLMKYLSHTQITGLERINNPKFYHDNNFLSLDFNTKRNLELTEAMRTKNKKGSLLWVLDKTKTAMGKRLLRSWIEKPLVNCTSIINRQTAVAEFAEDISLRMDLRDALSDLIDIERLMTRVVYGSANPKEIYALGQALTVIPEIKKLLSNGKSLLLKEYYSMIDELDDIKDLILKSVREKAPITVKEGGIFNDGFDDELDRLRFVMNDSATILAQIETRERESTGIPKLKVGYNRVFGYYIEVSNSYKDMIPETYIRKQTLTGCERYITSELKEVEGTILGAKDRSYQLEYQMFTDLMKKIASNLVRISKTAEATAAVDVLLSLAQVACDNRYCRPEVNNSDKIIIKESRHPVVELLLTDSPFVPNDVLLDRDENRTAIITGPNMAGKSTYMRQVALIVIMAQIGSFVPAKSAEIGITDAVFTRVGASDDLTTGQSTFMVEMNEVANIVKSATKHSLLILDEIGRGTSTYDGMSIARAVLEYVTDKNTLGAKTLFATHYHELTILENLLDGVKNYNIAVKKRGFDITFLRRIVPGGADESYGVEVARLAGVPESIVLRAKEILGELESGEEKSYAPKQLDTRSIEDEMMDAFTLEELKNGTKQESEIEKKLKKIDIDTLTPIESMKILYDLVKEAKG